MAPNGLRASGHLMSPINVRLRLDSAYIVVTPGDNGDFNIEITDAIGDPVPAAERAKALTFLLYALSRLRRQVFDLLGGALPKVPKP